MGPVPSPCSTVGRVGALPPGCSPGLGAARRGQGCFEPSRGEKKNVSNKYSSSFFYKERSDNRRKMKRQEVMNGRRKMAAPLPCPAISPRTRGWFWGFPPPFSPHFPFIESFQPRSGSPRRAAGDGDSAQAPLGATCSGRKVLPAGRGTSVSFATSSSGLCPADSPAGPLPGLKQSRRRQHTNKFQCFRGAEVGGGTSGRDAGPKGPLSYEDTNRV